MDGGGDRQVGCKEEEDVTLQERRTEEIVCGGGVRQMECKEKEDVIQ